MWKEIEQPSQIKKYSILKREYQDDYSESTTTYIVIQNFGIAYGMVEVDLENMKFGGAQGCEFDSLGYGWYVWDPF